MKNVLALDLSSKTGWAIGGPDKGLPITGVWRLASVADPIAQTMAFVQLHRHLMDAISAFDIGVLVFEAPLPAGAHAGRAAKSPDLARGLIGLSVVAETCGGLAGIETLTADVQTVRRYFVGHGRPADPKAVVMARCRQLGWRVEDDNAADAAALWSFEMSCRYPKWAPKATPLFAKEAAA